MFVGLFQKNKNKNKLTSALKRASMWELFAPGRWQSPVDLSVAFRYQEADLDICHIEREREREVPAAALELA